MLEPILGSVNAEKVLIYLFVREKGYPREIANFYDINVRAIQNQL